MSLLVRDLYESDIDECISMSDENFDGIYKNGKNDLLEGINDPNQFYKALTLDNKIIGFIGFSEANFTYNCYGIYWFNINSQYQRNGYGKYLLNYVIDELKNKPIYKDIYNDIDTMWLILTCKTDKVDFYKKFGFKIINVDGNKNLMLFSL